MLDVGIVTTIVTTLLVFVARIVNGIEQGFAYGGQHWIYQYEVESAGRRWYPMHIADGLDEWIVLGLAFAGGGNAIAIFGAYFAGSVLFQGVLNLGAGASFFDAEAEPDRFLFIPKVFQGRWKLLVSFAGLVLWIFHQPLSECILTVFT